MPDRITDPPPADVASQLAALSAALDQVIPPKQAGQNLLIGTWNVRAFERLTPKWRSVSGDSPIRDLSNLLCIAEVVRRFDVVAVKEVRRTGQALLAMLQVLGGRCCIWTIRGRLKLGPLSLDQIAKARSSNATVSRWPAGTSTASS